MAFTDRLANRGSVSTGYDIENSVRLEADNSQYLKSASISTTPTNAKIGTYSCWIKRTELGANYLLVAGNSARYSRMFFNSDDKIQLYAGDSSWNSVQPITNAVYKDASAWYHIVLRIDSTDGTAANRLRLYVNGVEQTWATAPNIDEDGGMTLTEAFGSPGYQSWGANLAYYTASAFFSGYLAEVHYVDGQSLAPTEFGEFDADSGIWKPKKYSGSHGNCGYYMDFADSGNLGDNEASTGSGFDFAENNIAAVDQSADTPTNNFCTLNPNDRRAGVSTVISKGALSYTSVAGNYGDISMTMGVGAGKWYYEIKTVATGGNATHWVFSIRDADATENANGDAGWGYAGTAAAAAGQGKKQWGFHSSGYVFNNTSAAAQPSGSPSDTQTGFNTGHNEVGNIFGIAIDMDNGKYWVGRNLGSTNTGNFRWYDDGSLNTNYGNPVTGAYPLANNLLTGTNGGATLLLPCFALYSGSGTGTAEFNFGSPPYTPSSGNPDANGYGNFEHTVPTGYYALCTKNLAEFG